MPHMVFNKISRYIKIHSPFCLTTLLIHFYLWCKLHLKNQKFLFASKTKRFLSYRVCSLTWNLEFYVPFFSWFTLISDGITSIVKLFADDTCIFSTIRNINYSASNLNSDLQKISEWAFKWKMSSNTDSTKQAQEVIFSWKMIEPSHPLIKLNNLPVPNASSQKHLGMILDEKLDFEFQNLIFKI